jgi:hypothetical protein
MTLRRYPRKNSIRRPLHRKLESPQTRSGSYEEEKNLLPLPGIELRFLGQARNLFTVTNELSSFYLGQKNSSEGP